ncbi:MAG: radical SAM family heme chaperone HemW [Bacteroidia bacterium]|nr:radical SAM family heme chaperone HemW [Bacteroidia bacterium]MCF8445393.1 radical SAM family heme chaperone HemW [Bacteroidia bacterium]
MAGIYIHIPFCKQACNYCNFHFSTVLSYKEKLVETIAKELFLRKNELRSEPIETIYFGGGTPSLLNPKELDLIIDTIYKHYDISGLKEFTLEANPDDMKPEWLQNLKGTPVNRLSIGVQSFEDEHLKLMNRAHLANEALTCIEAARNNGIEQISIDLIYGIPGMSLKTWEKNIQKALDLNVEHISSYCLTIEPKTVFGHQQRNSLLRLPCEEDIEKQFFTLLEKTGEAGFDHYEISNFAKKDFYALHNTNYWKGKSYLGIGPGAHSYFPGIRQWNVANNQKYIQELSLGNLVYEQEKLSKNDQFNEYVMTGLRTKWGINLTEIENQFGQKYIDSLRKDLAPYLENKKVKIEGQYLILTPSGKFLADGIASAAFVID